MAVSILLERRASIIEVTEAGLGVGRAMGDECAQGDGPGDGLGDGRAMGDGLGDGLGDGCAMGDGLGGGPGGGRAMGDGRILDGVISAVEKSAAGACKGDGLKCGQASVSGAVSQKACVFCGARVVLNPITDAVHIIHGPIGCSSYTWDIRGSLSSGSELYRQSFSTDMRERDVIFGGEKKLAAGIDEAAEALSPPLIFVYATCIAGVIGDDVRKVCQEAEKRHAASGLRVIPVMAPGFSGHKAVGYRLAGDAIMEYLGCGPHASRVPPPRNRPSGVNILGDFNLAGESWIVRRYLEDLGIEVKGSITGDASAASLLQARGALLNVVQCAGSSMHLAQRMRDELGIPFIRVSFYGIEDSSDSLVRTAAKHAELAGGDAAKAAREAGGYCEARVSAMAGELDSYRKLLAGRQAAIYVGGGFKAISLVKQFRELGMETVMVGTQTGRPEEYQTIRELVAPGCIVLDDANPAELEMFLVERGADILVGGVKERPLAYKLGVAFLDHNHERKHPLAGFEGVLNFCAEVNGSVNSPVWAYAGRQASYAERQASSAGGLAPSAERRAS
jgi:nitrogenase molybdenum-cofactor synthesis protein NifE